MGRDAKSCAMCFDIPIIFRNFAGETMQSAMKKSLFNALPAVLLLALTAHLASCSQTETYAEQKDKEVKAIQSFLNRDIVVSEEDGTVLCNVGTITPITEEEFENQGHTTDLSRNEYVLFSNSGVYMQIVRPGTGEKLESGQSARIGSKVRASSFAAAITPSSRASASAASSIRPPRAVFISRASGFISRRVSAFIIFSLSAVRGQCRLTTSERESSSSRLTVSVPSVTLAGVRVWVMTFIPKALPISPTRLPISP